MKTAIYKAHRIVASAEFLSHRASWTRHAHIMRVGQEEAAIKISDAEGGCRTKEDAEEGGALEMAKNWVDELVPDH